MQSKIVPVVMCGGSGTRLWPLSRTLYPKQFLPLVNENSLLQNTLARLPEQVSSPIFICNEAHRFLVAEQIRAHNITGQIILEPEGRNTAPAVALAALAAVEQDENAILLVLASDHVMQDATAFHQAIEAANHLAEKDHLVTFGIVPTHAETGYGYIRKGDALVDAGFNVAEFVEKPNLERAQQFLASGDYLWNSGMFMFKAASYLTELQQYKPELLAQCQQAMQQAESDLDFIRPESSNFLACEDISIDYAVMEPTQKAVTVPLDAGWNDVGSYAALWDIADKDNDNNVLQGDVISVASHDCYVKTSNKLVATVGVENLVVVETSDAVLVANKDKVQDIKAVVNQLKAENRSEAVHHRDVYRPWGYYDSIDMGERFQVKRIVVHPGAKLSVQMHHHRAEHWIVVSGTANVTIDDKTTLLTENQSCYIPIGAVHALENPGKVPLELIEVQSGSYLGEDDIVRFEDRYGRAK